MLWARAGSTAKAVEIELATRIELLCKRAQLDTRRPCLHQALAQYVSAPPTPLIVLSLIVSLGGSPRVELVDVCAWRGERVGEKKTRQPDSLERTLLVPVISAWLAAACRLAQAWAIL